MNEADDDKYVSIGYGRYKEKGKEDDDNADVYVKTDSGKFVKSSDQEIPTTIYLWFIKCRPSLYRTLLVTNFYNSLIF